MSQAFALPVACECIRALREIKGVNIRGNANTIPVTHSIYQAVEGDVLLTDIGRLDHGELIVGFEGSVHEGTYTRPEYILTWGCNWRKCECGPRKVLWTDDRTKGIYRPVEIST